LLDVEVVCDGGRVVDVVVAGGGVYVVRGEL
jgi:hypothetical protein